MKRERETQPCPSFLDRHASPAGQGLTAEMRAIAVSWMGEVVQEFQLQQETLFLAVSIMDRFLSNSQVPGVLDFAAVGPYAASGVATSDASMCLSLHGGLNWPSRNRRACPRGCCSSSQWPASQQRPSRRRWVQERAWNGSCARTQEACHRP